MKQRNITRTIYVTILDVMTVSTETREVYDRKIDIPSIDSIPEKELPGFIQSQIELFYPDEKFVAETGRTTQEILYSMPESEFIRLATIIPGGR